MARVQVTKTDGSVLDWKVSDDKADGVISLLFKREYSRENAANWKRRGPKPKTAPDDAVFQTALRMRAEGMGKEEIARELKVSSRTLGRNFDRYDAEAVE